MNQQPSIRFMSAKDVVWNRYRYAAQLIVYVDGKLIRCRISPECIDDHCGNPRTPLRRTEAARAHFDEITERLTRLILSQRFEADGSILLRSSDWWAA
jgi:hypothetical protein